MTYAIYAQTISLVHANLSLTQANAGNTSLDKKFSTQCSQLFMHALRLVMKEA